MAAEELTKEFMQALQQGQQVEQSKKGYASLANMVAMFYEGLHGAGLPEPLVYILTCNYASQVMEALALNPAVQAPTGGKEGSGDDRG